MKRSIHLNAHENHEWSVAKNECKFFFTLNEITGACVVCNEKICIWKIKKKKYFAILISVSSSLISHFHFILLFRMIHQPFCKPAYQDAIPTRSDVKSDVTVT